MRVYTAAFFLCLASLLPAQTHVQWEFMGGPLGAEWHDVSRSVDGTIYGINTLTQPNQITVDSIVISADYGRTFHAVRGLHVDAPSKLIIDENGGMYFLYGVYAKTTLEFSSDNGTSWHDISPAALMGSVTFGPPGGVYVTSNDSIFFSNDTGRSWQGNDMPLRTLELFFEGDSYLYAHHIRNLGTVLSRSTDGGKSWESLPRVLDWFGALTVHPGFGLLHFSGYSVSRSSDHGTSWEVLQTFTSSIEHATTTTRGIAVASPKYDTCLVSTDGGSTWTPSPVPSQKGNTILDLTPGGPDEILVSTMFGLYSFIPSTNKWELLDSRRGHTFEAIGIHPLESNRLLVDCEEQGRYIMDASAKTWNYIDAPFSTQDDLHGVARGKSGEHFLVAGDAMYRSGDGGYSWEHMTTGDPDWDFLYIAANSRGELFAGVDTGYHVLRGIFISTDNGTSWRRSSYNAESMGTIRFDAFDSIYTTSGQRIIRSSPGGYEFYVVPSPAPLEYFDVAYDSRLYAATRDTLYLSSNGGVSWESSGFHDFRYLTGVIGSTVGTYIATQNGSVWVSQNGRGPWVVTNTGLPLTRINDIDLGSDNRMYVATQSGLYRSVEALDVTTVNALLQQTTPSVSAAWPNPVKAGEHVNVQFVPAESGVTDLTVFNMLGVKMYSTSYAGRKTQPMEVTIPTATLLPGVYQYMLSCGAGIQTGTLIVQ